MTDASFDRRDRQVRFAAAVAAVACAVVGITTFGACTTRGSTGAPVPSASSTPGPQVSSPQPSSPQPEIPNRAFLNEQDRDHAAGEPPAVGTPLEYLNETAFDAPLTCDGGQPSQAPIHARRTVSMMVPGDGVPTPESVQQTIIRFSGDGAARFLREVRDALTRCRQVTDQHRQRHHRTVITSTERSLTVADTSAVRYVPEAPEVNVTTYLGVVRIGDDTILILYDQGWEASSASRRVFDKLLPRAVRRAEAWRAS